MELALRTTLLDGIDLNGDAILETNDRKGSGSQVGANRAVTRNPGASTIPAGLPKRRYSRMNLTEELRQHLEPFHTAPFLFVGSGLSRRYLGLEDWEGILQRFAGMTSRPYEYYRATGNGSLPAVAAEIARNLHDLWWSSPNFEDARTKYASDCRSPESALKIEISRYLEAVSSSRTPAAELTAELTLLPKAKIDGIITTNWDLLLEQLFPGFKVYVGQDELLFASSQGVGEIYKIHGCCSKPNSLVATTADYARFASRNPYLAAKLLTVFAEHPIIFLGYSLSDENVSNILQSIAQCLTSANIKQLRDRLILVQRGHDEGHRWEDNTLVLNGFSMPVKTITTKSFLDVFDCLADLPRKFPARILRQLKAQVYELVHDNDPADRLHVMDIDDDTDPSLVRVVYGVGRTKYLAERLVRLSDNPDASPVRLSDDPTAPPMPYSRPPEEVEYSSLQAELQAMVLAWRSDNLAYIARSRLRAFYAGRASLDLNQERAKCLLMSAMHHGGPVHYWAHKVGRKGLIELLRGEVPLDLYPRIRSAARLAFAAGLSDGRAIVADIAKKSKFDGARKLATRLLATMDESIPPTAEYRSPSRSAHTIGEKTIEIDVATIFEHLSDADVVLTHLALQTDVQSQSRLKQIDAYIYSIKL